jgi:hypothetical protein
VHIQPGPACNQAIPAAAPPAASGRLQRWVAFMSGTCRGYRVAALLKAEN